MGDVSDDRTAMARATRDLRYYGARFCSAQRVDPVSDPNMVGFGCAVTVERDDGRVLTSRIVGEDESDPSAGKISYISPMAKALLGWEIGDEATLSGAALEITAISA